MKLAGARLAPEPRELRVQLLVSGDLDAMSPARRTALLEALAAILEIEFVDVKPTAVYQAELTGQPKPGRRGLLAWGIERLALRRGKIRPDPGSGVVFDLLLPSGAALRLRDLVKSNSPRLGLLRVKKVVVERTTGSLQEWQMEAGRFAFVPPSPAPPAPQPAIRVSLFRPVLVALMIGCLVWALVQFIKLVSPDWRGGYLVLVGLLAAVEAGYSFRLAQRRRRFSDEVLRFRLVELATLFILIKIGGFIGDSWRSVWSEIRIWPHAPLTIFDLETLVAFALALVAWVAATITAQDLNRLGEPPLRSRDYVPPLESLSQRFFWGGGILLLVSGIVMLGRTVTEVSSWALQVILRELPRFSSADLALGLLLYFLLGLVILGQIHYDLLNRRWQVQGIPVDPAIARRWARYSLAFLGLTALVALLLPTRFPGSLTLFRWIGIAFQWLSTVVFYVVGFFIFIITGILGFVLSFFIKESQGEVLPQPSPPVFDAPPAVVTAPGVTPDWVLLMRSLLFWALLLAGLWFVLRSYLRDHPELAEGIKGLKPVRALQKLWAAISAGLMGFLRRWKKTIQQHMARRDQEQPAERQVGQKHLPFFRLGRLSPRERVLYYYWSILQRAQGLGLARRPSQTPYEYDSALEPHLPEAEKELDRLTESFIEARYSQHPVEADQDRELRGNWQAVRAAMRGLARKGHSKMEQ